ncbi:sulfotransferase [Thiocapsa bogorovii]|uniref:sulfotransferase n=1 Tax=Thiocapsa bogorovii TaxID=521689 RepID=UPI001E56AAF7|nr:sulfotransferase [Thiocapsa bogorovii]UHD15465.1 sulfotransferase domain-containing protein [Thiocapsa bogorovii]
MRSFHLGCLQGIGSRDVGPRSGVVSVWSVTKTPGHVLIRNGVKPMRVGLSATVFDNGIVNAPEGAPHFLIVGACKSGTTSLYDDLAAHPDAALPTEKEPDILHQATSPEEALGLWRKHFGRIGRDKIRGEASTTYTMAPDCADVSDLARAALGPEARIIYIMRDPIHRIESHLAHDFAAKRLERPEFDRTALDIGRYVACSDYARQIKPWINAFERRNVLPVIFEDYVRARYDCARSVASFVGLDPTRLPARSAVSNPRDSRRAPKTSPLGRFVSGRFYRQRLRWMFPDVLRQAAKVVLIKKREIPPVRLAPETRIELARRLAHVPDGLRQLGIEPGDWCG